jgi:signal transduction histidine kinase
MAAHPFTPQRDSRFLLENRLLTIFQILAFIRLLTAIVFLIMPRPEATTLRWSQTVIIVEVSILWLYLAIPALKQVLGRFYLPIAIGWATVIPLLVQNLTLYHEFQRMTSSVSEAHPFLILESSFILSSLNHTILVLIVPLIVVAWAYSPHILIVYCLTIALFDLSLNALFLQLNPMVFIISFALILFRTLLYGVIGSVINRLVNVQLEQEHRLMDANVKLREYAMMREELATSRERNRIARELHDTLAHTLSVATVQLEAVSIIWQQQPQKAHDMVTKSAAMMRDGLAETRRALQALRSGPLDNNNLVNAITALAESLMTRYPLTIEVRASSPINIPNTAVEHGLYRILQEAMFNAVSHAQASHLLVRFDVSDHHLIISVTDNGVGFTPQTVNAHGHFGLRGMQERAEHIHAELHITSTVGAGTSVIVRLERNHDQNSYL